MDGINMMSKIVKALRAARSIVITSHIQPDGDAVGSTVALLRALKKLGKTCQAISPSHIPSVLEFVLQEKDEVVRYRPERDDVVLSGADLFVVVDCSDLERAGEVGEKMKELGKPMLVIDHHLTNEGFGMLNYVKTDASSVGELLMELLEELGVPISLDIALPLYVAIVTDTGGFNYPRTTKKTHSEAGKLLEAGVNPYEVHRKLLLERSLEFTRLAGLAVFSTSLAYDGKVAYSIVHNDIYDGFTPRIDEMVMLPPYLLSISGVEVGVLFLEDRPGRVIVELRSQGLVDVSVIGRKFGGGGHSGAAGARITGEMTDVVHRVLSEIKKRLDEAKLRGVSEECRCEILCRT